MTEATTINKVSESELSIIKDIINHEHETLTKLGLIEYDLTRLSEEKNKAITLLNQLKEAKQKRLKELEDRHGPGRLNIDSGEFISTK